MGYADRTTLNNLTPNMDIGDVADPALRLAAFQYLYNLSDTNYAYLQSLVTSETLSPLPPDFMDRQAIINGNFDRWEQGTSFTSNSTYTADRWYTTRDGSGGFTNVSRVPFTAGQTEVPGEPAYYLRKECTVAPTGQTFNVILQKIESVRTFAGQTVTLSFYGRMDLARSGVLLVVQNFGSGGSPSVNAKVASVVYSTTFAMTTITFAMPSILGKTIGTNDCIEIQFHSPLNSVFTHDISQVQLCAGSTALPFQPRSIAEEVALCQRYYRLVGLGAFGVAASATNMWLFIPFSKMRTAPTASLKLTTFNLWDGVTQIGTTAGTLSTGASSDTGVTLNIGGFTGLTQYRVYALNTPDVIALDAEL